MCIRTILYGYEMKDGKFVISEGEASVVREVYDRYIAGGTFQKIADSLTERGVTYFMDSKVWNKNHIARMIGDKRYAGEDHYPPIITADINDEALMIKARRSSTKAELPGITKLIKSKLYCSVCGKHYNRKNKWKTREKWFCSGSCKCGVYLDDKTIFDGIQLAIENAVSQKQTTTYQGQASYQPTMEITRRNNEIRRMMEQPKFNFKAVADAIMECASQKYACCGLLCHAELILAAIAYEHFANKKGNTDRDILVFDMGAGTFDTTLYSEEIKVVKQVVDAEGNFLFDPPYWREVCYKSGV